jgi:hypothetical protein
VKDLDADGLLALSPRETDEDRRSRATPDELIIEALRRALAVTTPLRAGAPWEYHEAEPKDDNPKID